MNAAAQQRYLARFQRVLDHVDAHLDGDLSVEALASVAAVSPFHFHRQFTTLTGLTLHRHVKLVRLKRPAFALAYRPTSLRDTPCSPSAPASSPTCRSMKR